MHSAIKYALSKGAEYVEVKQAAARRVNIEVQDCSVKEFSSSDMRSFGVRVFAKGGEGIVFSTKENYKEMIDTALVAAKKFTKKLSLSRLSILKREIKTKVKIHPEDISLEEKKERVVNLFRNKKVSSSRAVYTDIIKKNIFENSEGREWSWDDVISGISLQAFAKKGATLENFYEGVRVHGGWEVMEQAEMLTQECVKMANALLTAKYVKGGNVPVLIDQKLGGVFAHEAVGHGCEADCVLQESSVFKEKLGKKVANEKLTLIDDGTKEGFYGWVPLDDEGVEGQKTMLIEDGVLKNFLHSRETATRMKMLPTGNGRAESLGNPVIPRMRCTYIEKGNDKFEDMLKEIKDGYYLKGTLGGEVNPSTGEFLFNAQYGYKVKNGEIKEMVKAVSLGGSILEILPKIKMIGKDLDFSQGTCGKGGQSVPVSDGAPHMLIEKAKVGGK